MITVSSILAQLPPQHAQTLAALYGISLAGVEFAATGTALTDTAAKKAIGAAFRALLH
jgi:hypothetical protein